MVNNTKNNICNFKKKTNKNKKKTKITRMYSIMHPFGFQQKISKFVVSLHYLRLK